ncbi:MAG: DUF4363 family protein [Clostridia bacterium]|nr:DUF4363 family protein [Clostridia bacterium]
MTRKRLGVAICVLVVMIGLGVLEQVLIAKTFAEFEERLNAFIVEEDEEYDYDAIVETQKWWEKKAKYLELFLPHVQIVEITITYGELVGAVGAEDHDSAQALLNRIKSTVESFYNNYSVRIGNVV